MAIPVWPASLPASGERDSFQEIKPNNLYRSNLGGITKVRRKGAELPTVMSFTMTLDDTQRSTFETFVHTTLDDGALRFEYTHPVDSSTIECRFLPTGGSNLYTLTSYGILWKVSVQWEVLP